MQLFLSNPSPINCTYTNSEGQALYSVRTPSRIFGRMTAICRVSNDLCGRDDKYPGYDCSVRDGFKHLANFEWKSFRSSRLRFGEREFKTRSFFRKEGWGWHGRHRVFAGPDGREYKWKLNSTSPELNVNDGAETPVARYHSGRSGLFSKPQDACLEICPAGEHMVDAILVTFIYIEKLREDE